MQTNHRRLKENPFNTGEVTEDKLHLLFGECTFLWSTLLEVSVLIGEPTKHMCVPVLGKQGSGKSSLLNRLAVDYRAYGLKVLKISVENLAVSEVKSMIENVDMVVIDNVDKVDDEHVLSVYHQIEEYVHNGKMVLFADNLGRGNTAVKERHKITIPRAIILQDLWVGELENLLRERMEKCGYVFRFSREAVELAARRSKGNLRDFFRYCDAAYRLFGIVDWLPSTSHTSSPDIDIISEKLMGIAILAVDKDLISDNEIDRDILEILYKKKSVNASELLQEIKSKGRKVSTSTVYRRLKELTDRGIIVSKKVGHNVKYSVIYHEIGIDDSTISQMLWV